jgi:spore coat polysaccharide biosynthesis predicted glycosyltransferase SpsG
MLNFCDTLAERNIPFRMFVNPHEVSEALLAQRHIPFETVDLAAQNGWQSALVRKHHITLWVDDRLDTEAQHAAQIGQCGIPRVTFDDRGPGAVSADLNIAALACDASESLSGKRVLRGPRFLVLNRDIARYRRLRTAEGSVIVTLGGSDTYGVTITVMRMLKAARRQATIIVGPGFEHEAELNAVLNTDFVLKRGVPSLVEEFSHHELAITGGGITPFEANASGLPCIVIAAEPFEVPVGKGLATLGGCVFAGHYSQINEAAISAALPIAKMSKAALESIDLNGAARVADEIEGLI